MHKKELAHRRRAIRWFCAALTFLPTAVIASEIRAGRLADAAERATAPRIERWEPYIEEASLRFGIPEDWIRRVMDAESQGRTMLDGRPITSRAGAMGLMQLMPGTWAEMRVKHGLGPNPHDPRDNILAGTAYLRAMQDRFGYEGMFAAYNSGPGRYAEHLASGRRLPVETLAYIAKTRPGWLPRPAPLHELGTDPIFVALAERSSPVRDNLPISSVGPGPIFALLGAGTASK